jgi:hypothetical protein
MAELTPYAKIARKPLHNRDDIWRRCSLSTWIFCRPVQPRAFPWDPQVAHALARTLIPSRIEAVWQRLRWAVRLASCFPLSVSLEHHLSNKLAEPRVAAVELVDARKGGEGFRLVAAALLRGSTQP